MKTAVVLFNLLATIFLVAQPGRITELNGVDDLQANSHLFYRHYRTNVTGYNWVSDIKHFDLAANVNTLFIRDFFSDDFFGFRNHYTTDIEFFNYDPVQYIYSYTYSEIDPSAYIERYDGTVFTDLGESGRLAISAQNDSLLYAGKPYGGIMRSTDHGDSWEDIGVMYDTLFLELSPFNDSIVFAVNYDAHLLKSTDGGLTFSTVDTAGNWNIQHNLQFDPGEMYVYSISSFADQYHLFRSSDTGNNWQTILSDSSKIVTETDPVISGKLYLSVGKQISVSNDFGETFSVYWELPFDIVGLYKKPDSEILYGATNFDIYEITSSDTTSLIHLPIMGIETGPELVVHNFELKQNYPNPFNPATVIELSLSKSQHIMLTVFDLAGKKIQVLIDGKIPAGSHKVNFAGHDLASGIYFYQLKLNSLPVGTKKMILLK